ncbi:Sporulation domain protein [Paenibacillus curdlanolyticus YK9]|uniref:Sporulation domain protein n=1 Tax=Paenibacillus curdlanolyticus YK9 TaxID=717606 RepID=E0IDU3_9BACL|nr:SPOR domain-containing protein [Paenibacillus curdlanolyticus]EFM09297.1 Sporulation domain protein [Paenibacillus curdlanolyticus YK9]
MKRESRMTFRFDANEAQSGRLAADEKRIKPQMRVVSDRLDAAEGVSSSLPEHMESSSRDPLFQSDIQALELLIRSENGAISETFEHGESNGQRQEPAKEAASERTWHFPEPIQRNKRNLDHTERKLISIPNRIQVEDADVEAARETMSIEPTGYPDERVEDSPKKDAIVKPDLSDLLTDESFVELTGQRFDKRSLGVDYTRTHPRGPSWLKVFASVTGAIATGALFGYLALSLFAGQGPWADDAKGQSPATLKTSAENSDRTSNGEQSVISLPNSPGTGAAEPTGSSGSSASVKLNLPAVTYSTLQYGVFSSAEGADAAVKELKDKGLAAYRWDTEQDYRVYVGVSRERDGALALSQSLGGIEVYVKSIELPAVDKMAFAGESSQLQQYWEQTNALVSTLDRLTLDQLELATPQPISGAQSAAWSKQHEQWLATSSAIRSKLTDEQKKLAVRLEQAINTAAVSLAEYNKKPAEAHLWNAQSALMTAIFVEKGWLESNPGL